MAKPRRRPVKASRKPAEIAPTLLERSLAGGTLASGGAAAAAASGSSVLATVAMAAAGMALPYAEIVASRIFDEFRSDARARVEDMLAEADRELGGGGPERLAEMTGKSYQTRLLTAMAVDAAARTAWPPKVVALGRVLAAGLIGGDEAKIDEEQLALSAMADMERPHVLLLDLLVNPPPEPEPTAGEVNPDWRNPHRPRPVKLTLDAYRTWTFYQIGSARPQLRPVLTSLIGTLQQYGLAVQNDNTIEVFKKFSEMTAADVDSQPTRDGGDLPTVPAAPRRLPITEWDLPAPNWSTTELGERVLGFYRLAADEAGAESEQGK